MPSSVKNWFDWSGEDWGTTCDPYVLTPLSLWMPILYVFLHLVCLWFDSPLTYMSITLCSGDFISLALLSTSWAQKLSLSQSPGLESGFEWVWVRAAFGWWLYSELIDGLLFDAMYAMLLCTQIIQLKLNLFLVFVSTHSHLMNPMLSAIFPPLLTS